MQSHVGWNIGDTEERIHLRPLTRCNKQGEVYQRSTAVESQIKSALALSPDRLLERALLQDDQLSDYLREECLVYLIREYKRKGHEKIINDLSQILLRRCAKYLHERLHSLGPDRVEDAISDIVLELFTQILELDNDRGDFLQVRFWVVLESLVITTFGRYIKGLKESENTVPLSYEQDTDDSNNRGSIPPEDSALPALTVEQRLLYREGLNTLEKSHRVAFVLRHYYDWPIESNNPSQPTICRYFGKTSRTIRLWLAKAEETLERWRGEHNGTP